MKFDDAIKSLSDTACIRSVSAGSLILKLPESAPGLPSMPGKFRFPYPAGAPGGLTKYTEPTEVDLAADDWEVISVDSISKPDMTAQQTPPVAMTRDQYEAVIADLVGRMRSADAVIMALVHLAGGEVKVSDADAAAAAVGRRMAVTQQDDGSWLFRLVPDPGMPMQ